MIRFNHNSVLPWTIKNTRSISRVTDEELFFYLRDQSHIGFDTYNLVLLGETLITLDSLREKLSSFYLNNKYEVDSLCTHIGLFIRRRSNDSLSLTSPSEESENLVLDPDYPKYLGDHKWSIGPSCLDQVD